MHRKAETTSTTDAVIGDSDAAVDNTAATAATPPAAARIGRPSIKLGTALKWSYVVTTGGNVLLALLTFVIAAILGPREFGIIALAMVWVSLGLVLLQHGPTIAVIQQDDITDEHVNASFWATVAGAVGYAVVLAITAPVWAAVNDLPELTPVCLALTPVVVLQSLNVIQDAVLRRRMQMRGIAIRVMLANLGAGCLAIGLAIAGFGVWALVAQQLAWPALYSVMLWPIAGWRPSRGPVWRPLRDLRRTSLHTYGGAIGSHMSTRVDVVLMGLFFGPVVIGLYRFAARLAEMANELTSGGLRLVSLPHLSRHGQDTVVLQRELGRLVRGIAVVAFPALGILAGVAHPLLLVVGDQWTLAADPLRVLCVAVGVTTTGVTVGVALQAKQRPGIPAAFTWVTVTLASIAIFVTARLSAGSGTEGKLMAVAWSMLVVQTVVAGALCYITFRRVLHVSPWPTALGAVPGLAAAVCAAVVGTVAYRFVDAWLNRFMDLAVTGGLATIAAAIVLLGLDREARTLALGLLARLRRQPATGTP